VFTADDQVQLYGADWCSDTRQITAWLTRHQVPFAAHDTTIEAVRTRAVEIAGGRTEIPVLVTPDGTVLVEPTPMELAATLAGLRRPRRSSRRECR
jgi:mycoredoxin